MPTPFATGWGSDVAARLASRRAGVFTLLLVFNIFFARIFLRESVTPSKVGGALIIVAGVSGCIVAAPEDTQTKFTPDDIVALIRRPVGAAYLGVLVTTLLVTVAMIVYYECAFPTAPEATTAPAPPHAAAKGGGVAAVRAPTEGPPPDAPPSPSSSPRISPRAADGTAGTAGGVAPLRQGPSIGSPLPPPAQGHVENVAIKRPAGRLPPLASSLYRPGSPRQVHPCADEPMRTPPATDESSTSPSSMPYTSASLGFGAPPAPASPPAPAAPMSSARGGGGGGRPIAPLTSTRSASRVRRTPPPCLDRLMSVIYPLSLGLDEGCAQLSLRAWLAVITSCGSDGISCHHWTLYVFLVAWIIFSLACVPYMRLTFRRYETT